MKRLLKKFITGFTISIVLIGIPTTFGFHKSGDTEYGETLPFSPAYVSAAGCTIHEATISPHTEQGSGGSDGFYSNASRANNPVSVSIYTTGCAGTILYVSLTSTLNNGMLVNEPVMDQKPIQITTGGTGAIRFTLTPGEKKCYISAAAPDCRYGVRVGTVKDSYDYNSFYLKNGRLEYECEGVCNDDWIYKTHSGIPNPFATPHIPKSGCAITWGTISPSTQKGSFDNSYYSDPNRKSKKVSLKVYTSGCENAPIYVALTQFSTANKPTNGWVDEEYDSEDKKGNTNVRVLDSKPITSSTGAFEIQLYPGQERCAAAPGVADCRYSMRLGVEPNKYTWSTRDETSGNLDYDCDSTNGLCPDKGRWEIISIKEIANTPPAGAPQPAPNPTPVTQNIKDTTDTCTDKDCYQTFSGLEQALQNQEKALGAQFDSFTDAQDLTDFINALVGFAIGIAGVLAVVMIMYEGFLYMSTDNVTTKASARSRIVNTVAGFVLLLSIYTLLRTINPDLLVLMPNIDYSVLDNSEQGDGSETDTTTSDQSTQAVPTSAPKACPAGITKVQGFFICKNLASGLNKMLNDAKSAGITLGGGGWRNPQTQIDLRIKNCGGNTNYNIYQKPSLQCTPPTAKPGTSRHESGLALDLTCNNAGTINVSQRPATAVCFNWLKSNASKYGFYNLPQENWHWSSDGK